MFKTMVIFLFLILSTSTVSASDAWSRGDIYREIIYSAIVAIDIGQTKQAIEDGYREANPFMGGYPSDKTINEHLISGLIAHVLISNYLSTENRKIFQNVTLILGATNISRNHMIGARIDY